LKRRQPLTQIPDAIADAWFERDNLVVLSPGFNRLSIPKEKLTKLLGSDSGQFAAFELDDDGRYLHWTHADVHLGWSQLLQLIDPAAVLEKQQKTKKVNARYGAAIRSERESQGVKQSGIDGLTERHLRRIEQGEQIATKASLAAHAAALGMSLERYLDVLAKRMAAK